MPRFLFVIRTGPGAGSMLVDALDMILTIATFDYCTRVAFIDEGVRHLTALSAPASEREERARGMVAALDLYEVREVIVGLESLRARGLVGADLSVAANVLPETMIAGLIAESERVQVA